MISDLGKYKKKEGGRFYQNYDTAVLEKAVIEYKKSITALKILAEKYGVPKITLCDY